MPTREELQSLADKRMTRKQIADHFGVHINTMHRWLRIAGVSTNGPKGRAVRFAIHSEDMATMRDRAMTNRQIAEHFGCHWSTVSGVLNERRRNAVDDVAPSRQAFIAANPFGL